MAAGNGWGIFCLSLLSTEQDFKMEDHASLVVDNWTSKAGKKFYFELLNNL